MLHNKQFNNLEIEAEEGFLKRVGEDKVQFADPFSTGITGWIDDGANFRLTFTNGLITAVADSTAGGHS